MPKVLKDPRELQIAVLGALLSFGMFTGVFAPSVTNIAATLFFAAFLEQHLWRIRNGCFRDSKATISKQKGDRPFVLSLVPSTKSAVISALSTLLMFRSDATWVYLVTVSLALGSKVALRVDGRHFLNPTNFGILTASALLPGWIASGQWGHSLLFAFVLLAGSSLLLMRAARIDTALSFLGGLGVFLAARTIWFGYPWDAGRHFFTNGSLWLFALYMITDPRTTPLRTAPRIFHGVFVAGLSVALTQFWYLRDAFLWALLFASPLVPLLNRLAKSPTSAPGTTSLFIFASVKKLSAQTQG